MSEPENTQTTIETPTAPTPTGKGSKEQTPTEKALPQSQVDAIVANERKQARDAAIAELVKKYGVESADALDARIKKLTDLETAQLTDIEKAQQAQQAAERERDEARIERDKERAERVIDRRNNAITAAAAKAHNPQDVILWAESDGKEHLEKVVKDDGSIDDAAVKALVAACQKAKSYLFGVTGPGSPSNRDGRPPSADAERIQKALEQRPKVRL
jgi:HSP90 family molecular chaperone